MAAYQLSRAGAYALVGALLGGVGGSAAAVASFPMKRALPWVMAAALIASALEIGRRLPPIPVLSRAARALLARGAKLAGWGRAGAIGAVTPLLPCGLLYGGYLAAAASGSALSGAITMGAFALGGAPALIAAQLWMARVEAPWAQKLLRHVLPVAAAAVLVFRALLPSSYRCH